MAKPVYQFEKLANKSSLVKTKNDKEGKTVGGVNFL